MSYYTGTGLDVELVQWRCIDKRFEDKVYKYLNADYDLYINGHDYYESYTIGIWLPCTRSFGKIEYNYITDGDKIECAIHYGRKINAKKC